MNASRIERMRSRNSNASRKIGVAGFVGLPVRRSPGLGVVLVAALAPQMILYHMGDFAHHFKDATGDQSNSEF